MTPPRPAGTIPAFPLLKYLTLSRALQLRPRAVNERQTMDLKMRSLAAFLLLTILSSASAQADTLSPPQGKIVLSITGNIDSKNTETAAVFDLPMLESIDGRSATMETPWTTGAITFDGPLLRNILAEVGAHGTVLRIRALNDYSADVPIEDAANYDTILAVRMDGKLMSVRDKGPLFLIYPFDKNPDLYNEKYFSRSVWQISEIEVLN